MTSRATIKPLVFAGQLMLGVFDEEGHLLREVAGPQQVRVYWPFGEMLERYVTETVTAAEERLQATEPTPPEAE